MAALKGPMLRMATDGDLLQLTSLLTAAQQADIPLKQEYFTPDWRGVSRRGPTVDDAPELAGMEHAVSLRHVVHALSADEFANVLHKANLPGARGRLFHVARAIAADGLLYYVCMY